MYAYATYRQWGDKTLYLKNDKCLGEKMAALACKSVELQGLVTPPIKHQFSHFRDTCILSSMEL